jgi:hypothetical protein
LYIILAHEETEAVSRFIEELEPWWVICDEFIPVWVFKATSGRRVTRRKSKTPFLMGFDS